MLLRLAGALAIYTGVTGHLLIGVVDLLHRALQFNAVVFILVVKNRVFRLAEQVLILTDGGFQCFVVRDIPALVLHLGRNGIHLLLIVTVIQHIENVALLHYVPVIAANLLDFSSAGQCYRGGGAIRAYLAHCFHIRVQLPEIGPCQRGGQHGGHN